MGRPLAELTLLGDERETLVRWSRRSTSAQNLAQRCRIVLGCADGKTNQEVAAELGIAVVIGHWRTLGWLAVALRDLTPRSPVK
jgi:hypothetical protein